ncbi:nucleoside diphosphate kinase [Caldanaerobius fijiensis DSM 17918]|uniref:Nucleoside diphosphate kinase n=1 Tax=Caldanaerobius fijiensis DSM 17918 TaxID=1121256 RepID=A0A1M4W1H1_9THEO|nr:nucleoside-diphosphate kinase [Caldanaerobius fijiensis]SHE74802.1 nucleoside diphosphate kinase [Caldanaerobius fijiensis DSM 17918]
MNKSNVERTFAMIKPDGVRRGLVGEIIKRYEQKGLRIVAAKLIKADRNTVEEHYSDLRSRSFFNELVEYILSGPIMVMILEGENAIKLVRMINGATRVEEALPGTIRGDYATSTAQNIVHGSDNYENAQREINLWFPELRTNETRKLSVL